MKDEMNWDAHIRSYLSSGLSAAGYCKKVGIKAHQFKYYYNKYRQGKKRVPALIESSPQMIPVNIKESTGKHSGDFEITFPNGCRCLVSIPFNQEAMSTIIKLLHS